MSINSSLCAVPTRPGQPARTPAVQRCCEARDQSLLESKAKKTDSYGTKEYAAEAYCAAMPDLSGYENIRDFIARTSYGMVNGLIDAIEGSKFLYAAQIASSVFRHEIKQQKQPAA